MMDIDNTLPNSSLEAMLLQEERGYETRDYLYQNELPKSAVSRPLNTIQEDRSKMIDWQYQVADFCRFDRETVEIATSYFDRFLMSGDAATEAFANTDLFQLAAMTCFYTAAKIHEPKSFEPWMLSKMSRGLYTGDQVERMEFVILKAIQWRTNPPTVLSFVREFLEILPSCYVSEDMKATVYDLCKFQTELSVRIYEFMPVKASTIAVGALMNALESVGMDQMTMGYVEHYISRVSKAAQVSLDTKVDVQSRLCQAVMEHSGIPMEAQTNSACSAKQALVAQSGCTSSPCSVQRVYSSAA